MRIIPFTSSAVRGLCTLCIARHASKNNIWTHTLQMAQRSDSQARPTSPGSCSSTSTLDSVSVTYETSPPLCSLLAVREHCLSRRPQTELFPGWGLVLRGTTSELSEGARIYTCQIESVHCDGAAKVLSNYVCNVASSKGIHVDMSHLCSSHS